MSRHLCQVVIVGYMVLSMPWAEAQLDRFGDELDARWLDRNTVPRANCLQFLVKAWPQ